MFLTLPIAKISNAADDFFPAPNRARNDAALATGTETELDKLGRDREDIGAQKARALTLIRGHNRGAPDRCCQSSELPILKGEVKKRRAFSPNPEWVFQTAEAFFAFTLLARKEADRQKVEQITDIPLSMNLAFATESYLKCLRVLESGECLEGHNLEQLFDDLDKNTALEIDRRHHKAQPTAPIFKEMRKRGMKTDLRSLLKVGGDAFEKFRYLYDAPSKKAVWCLEPLMLIVKHLIVEKRPDFYHLQNIDIPPDFLFRARGETHG